MTRTFVALCAVGGLWAVILAVLAQAWRMSTVEWFAENEQLSLTCIFVALIALGLVGARLVARKPRAPAVFDLDRELDKIIGLEPVKERIRELRDELEYDKTLRRAGVPALSDQASLHMVFQGNPGTGKTSVARLVARLLVEMGVLKGTRTGEPFVEVKRSKLIGSAVGETEQKTSAVIERARGGVLFVDEAYMLTNRGGNDFGPRAVEEIMNHMQDAEGPIFIFAGYLKEMEQFLLTNPGLRSRIGHTFDFADYDERDLAKIFTREVRSKNLELGSALSEDLLSCILHDYYPADRSEFNARLITKRFIPEVAKAKRKRTCECDDARVLGTITLEDVLTVIADHDQRWPRGADDINQRIVELAKSGSPAAREDAAKALKNLAFNSDNNKVEIAEAGGIAPLVALARDGTDGKELLPSIVDHHVNAALELLNDRCGNCLQVYSWELQQGAGDTAGDCFRCGSRLCFICGTVLVPRDRNPNELPGGLRAAYQRDDMTDYAARYHHHYAEMCPPLLFTRNRSKTDWDNCKLLHDGYPEVKTALRMIKEQKDFLKERITDPAVRKLVVERIASYVA